MRVADYYPHFRRNTIIKLVAVELIATMLSAGATYVVLLLPMDFMVAGMFGVVLFFAFMQVIILTLLFNAITEPVRIISQAINHVAKQMTDLPPPDINQRRYEKSGLKRVVQTIYDLALNAPEVPNAIPTTTNQQARTTTTNVNGLLDAVPCGIVGLNTSGEVVYANKHAPVIMAGDHGQEITLRFDKGDSLNDWRHLAATKLRDTKLWTRIADKLPEQDGRRIFDVIASYEKGSTSGYETILVTIDRTSTYSEAEEDMDFIALAAHELRGPITVIRGYLDVLGDELAPLLKADQTELIDRLNVSANRLSGYINNILNVSRYDRQHLELHLHQESLLAIIQSVWPDLEMRARTQNRLLTAQIPPDLPAVAADQGSLSEVISNLVDNAIKYSNDGGQVIVSASVKGDFVECTVQDFGIGIPSSVTGNLFSKFYRSHVSRSAVAGTGLGLYISKAIIDSHGGQIWVRSTEGQGTIFGFTLPVYATVADKLAATKGANEGIIETQHGWIKNHAMVRK